MYDMQHPITVPKTCITNVHLYQTKLALERMEIILSYIPLVLSGHIDLVSSL
jgi:hypothetical protein